MHATAHDQHARTRRPYWLIEGCIRSPKKSSAWTPSATACQRAPTSVGFRRIPYGGGGFQILLGEIGIPLCPTKDNRRNEVVPLTSLGECLLVVTKSWNVPALPEHALPRQ
ncbi:hypothetical protein Bbelb_380310 [Branchiostoma belcheri]|nr:hypothetical protein Bbelb_380310 [Branchiostoma belcheri]